MAFPLGVAIAELFQRVADLLRQGWWIPPSSSGGGSEISPIPPSQDDDPDVVLPPDVPEPTEPPVVPDVVEVPPPEEGIPSAPVDENGCPIVSPAQLSFLESGIYTAFAAISDGSTAKTAVAESTYASNTVALAQPGGHYLQQEDSFRFRVISTSDNVPVSFFGRIQYPTGGIVPFSFVLNTVAPDTVYSTTVQATAGVLLGAAASVPIGSISTGTVSAIAEIGRVAGSTFTPHTLLFSGQVDDFSPLSSNLSSPTAPLERPTFRGVGSAASEASPKDVIITPIQGRGVRITRVEAQIICSALVGNRGGMIQLITGGIGVWRGDGGSFITASQQVKITFAIGGQSVPTQDAGTDNGALLNCPFPETLYFYEPVTVQMVITSALAGDAISAALIRWEDV